MQKRCLAIPFGYGNFHEIAQQAAANSRVVYADIGSVAIAHSGAILAGHDNATIIDADCVGPR